ncbi:HAMP domain-containing histidine kinase [Paenibacillus thiaminolyticus]|uniref:histidine kinase n=1 Tax=Paenibacillus thiaminolyticus TaxID=49283 RepID=A0AAP9DXX8_PANTH|nr:HAMP domain-containing sensor histidine kinase [Paenibacillus thiaminolyticus]MCY9533830.1 HAMP domain-containing histidine kinase [Paenibacillus thiaminolyticus]MCY9601793.1 HAMP domain-containing histidine kinase [Paenibacillus thiaminolyticus]MCY9607075.1 HAMP domain-containing histidine kinase [Paenibacillus thiaminolyticus]MCY9614237.1 HAMP domain-containing histidine kinase [Paenibacillus thiaminolyticus]MCY9619206.1 HAMP domain-containing histidine kinase [Paenibacillus thiaminolytic
MKLLERVNKFKTTKIWRTIKFIGSIGVILLFMYASWSIAYLINPTLLRWFGWELTDYWAFVMTGTVGFLLLCAVIGIFMPFARNKHLLFYHSIVDAVNRISKGDFDVTITMNEDFEHEYGMLIESINKLAGELGVMEKMRQEFISNVSHEIQSPLTSIRGFAHALQSKELSEEERQHYLQIIEMETARLSKLSDNLLKLTSLESEHHPIKPQSYRLDQQLRTLVLASEPQWAAKGLDIELKLDKVHITADEDMLGQVWVNLIHNAIKFTPESGFIHIGLTAHEPYVEVRIEDSGIGIDEDHIPHLFERFFKADASRNRMQGGSGLGLSIVQKIVQLHQGTIAVSSDRGSGTVFCVKLPLHILDHDHHVEKEAPITPSSKE